MSKKEQFLFDIDCFKKGQMLYQVRLVKIDDESDQGEILATFVRMHNCAVMKYLNIPDGYELLITEYTKGEGITDIIDIDRALL